MQGLDPAMSSKAAQLTLGGAPNPPPCGAPKPLPADANPPPCPKPEPDPGGAPKPDPGAAPKPPPTRRAVRAEALQREAVRPEAVKLDTVWPSDSSHWHPYPPEGALFAWDPQPWCPEIF